MIKINNKTLIVCLLTIILIFTASVGFGSLRLHTSTALVFSNIPTMPSQITDTFNDIRVGVEKVIKEEYFIIYSYMTGDRSYLGINIIIEDTAFNPLPGNENISMQIFDDDGTAYKSSPASVLKDFPMDQPLGWKKIFEAKFKPLPKHVKYVDAYLTYNNHVYKLENIELP